MSEKQEVSVTSNATTTSATSAATTNKNNDNNNATTKDEGKFVCALDAFAADDAIKQRALSGAASGTVTFHNLVLDSTNIPVITTEEKFPEVQHVNICAALYKFCMLYGKELPKFESQALTKKPPTFAIHGSAGGISFDTIASNSKIGNRKVAFELLCFQCRCQDFNLSYSRPAKLTYKIYEYDKEVDELLILCGVPRHIVLGDFSVNNPRTEFAIYLKTLPTHKQRKMRRFIIQKEMENTELSKRALEALKDRVIKR